MSWQPSTENRSVTLSFIALPAFISTAAAAANWTLLFQFWPTTSARTLLRSSFFYGACQCCPAHEDFKQDFLDVQHGDSFTISEEKIKLWLAQRAKDPSSSN